MSNDIQTGKLAINIASSKAQSTKSTTDKTTNSSAPRNDRATSSVTVSMTEEASRLLEIESMLGAIPQVNNKLVSQISQLIASGKLEIDLDRTAARLIEMETGVQDPNK